MSALKSVIMVNIQSHVRTVLEFPQTGIVRFSGNNSNGKSVFVKVLGDVVSNAITRPAARRSIIRRGHDFCELMMERYDGVTLYVRIATEAASTFAELRKPDSDPVRRYLADKSIPLLVREFGWHYDGDNYISLNIHQDTDGFLFVDTRKKTNFELLNSARTDPYAEAAAESMDQLTKESKNARVRYAIEKEKAEAAYARLRYWDVEEEQSIRDKCLYLAQNLEALDMPPMPEIEPVPKVSFLPIVPPMPALQYVPLHPVFTARIPPIVEAMVAYQEVASGICPTCKRKLIL